jgi:hypothetical protein
MAETKRKAPRRQPSAHGYRPGTEALRDFRRKCQLQADKCLERGFAPPRACDDWYSLVWPSTVELETKLVARGGQEPIFCGPALGDESPRTIADAKRRYGSAERKYFDGYNRVARRSTRSRRHGRIRARSLSRSHGRNRRPFVSKNNRRTLR